MRVIQTGRMKLHEFQIGDPATRAPGHRETIAGRRIGIGRVEIDFARTAGGEHRMAGRKGLDLIGDLIQRIHAMNLALLSARMTPRNQVDRDVLLE